MTTEAAAHQAPWLRDTTEDGRHVLHAGGDWVVTLSGPLYRQLEALRLAGGAPVTFDLSSLTRLDTAGAWLLHRTAKRLRAEGFAVEYTGADQDHMALIAQAEANDIAVDVTHPRAMTLMGTLAELGEGFLGAFRGAAAAMGFVGLMLETLGRTLVQPRRFRLAATVHQMEIVGLAALPIVGLISFLIGIVIAYQGAGTLRDWGAEIMTVDLVTIAVVREFGILLSAIIIAGRSGSSFTAQIGSMVLHEEVDAMKSLALDPMEILVLPRFLALLLMMPLLTFYADVVGIIGGLLISWVDLGITPAQFIERAHLAITGWDFGVGMIKAPFFGAVIALVGCYEGLQVKGSAESVGTQTTKSVVEAIFLIIVLDAFFAVFFTTIGI